MQVSMTVSDSMLSVVADLSAKSDYYSQPGRFTQVFPKEKMYLKRVLRYIGAPDMAPAAGWQVKGDVVFYMSSAGNWTLRHGTMAWAGGRRHGVRGTLERMGLDKSNILSWEYAESQAPELAPWETETVGS